MSDPFVPSVGPALSSVSGGGVLAGAGVKMASNAAPVSPPPATTAPIYAPPEEVLVTTTQVNEQIRATLNVERLNPGGNGTYQITVDGVGIGPTRFGPATAGPDGLSIIDSLITIAAPGAHTVGAQVTSIGAPETVNGGARLLVQATQFT